MRGTEPIGRIEVPYDPGKDGAFAEFMARNPPAKNDYSLGNSEDTFHHACLALSIAQNGIFVDLVERLWDPGDADYIGWSGKQTPVAQSRAYAFKALVQGKKEEAIALAKKVFGKRKWDETTKCEAELINALANADKKAFLTKLGDLLTTVEWLAKMKENRFDTDYYVTIPGLGSILAIERGLITMDDLPDNPVLGKEIADFARSQ